MGIDILEQYIIKSFPDREALLQSADRILMTAEEYEKLLIATNQSVLVTPLYPNDGNHSRSAVQVRLLYRKYELYQWKIL